MGKSSFKWFQMRVLCMCKSAAAWGLLILLNMTTKQVETSITINTTPRSIFICTTINSYVQYFQRFTPFSFFFIFHYAMNWPPSLPTPLSSIFFHCTKLSSLLHPTPLSSIFVKYTKLSALPTLHHFHLFYFTIRICHPLPTLPRFHLLSLTIRSSHPRPTQPLFIYFLDLYLYEKVTHPPRQTVSSKLPMQNDTWNSHHDHKTSTFTIVFCRSWACAVNWHHSNCSIHKGFRLTVGAQTPCKAATQERREDWVEQVVMVLV